MAMSVDSPSRTLIRRYLVFHYHRYPIFVPGDSPGPMVTCWMADHQVQRSSPSWYFITAGILFMPTIRSKNRVPLDLHLCQEHFSLSFIVSGTPRPDSTMPTYFTSSLKPECISRLVSDRWMRSVSFHRSPSFAVRRAPGESMGRLGR